LHKRWDVKLQFFVGDFIVTPVLSQGLHDGTPSI
jgi:hypothetical protein